MQVISALEMILTGAEFVVLQKRNKFQDSNTGIF